MVDSEGKRAYEASEGSSPASTTQKANAASDADSQAVEDAPDAEGQTVRSWLSHETIPSGDGYCGEIESFWVYPLTILKVPVLWHKSPI